MKLTKVFSNPWVGGIGTLTSVAGLLLAVYFFLEAKESRRLGVFINPAKAVIVKAGQTSRLATSYDGKQVLSDITAAQITIWNYGKLPIKAENVLEPVALVVEHAQILEVASRRITRELTRFTSKTNERNPEQVDLSWGILESGDGVVLQLIYAGPPSAQIRLQGVIEGQRSGISVLNQADIDANGFGFPYRRIAFICAFLLIGLIIYDKMVGGTPEIRFGTTMLWLCGLAAAMSLLFGIFLSYAQAVMPSSLVTP